MTALSSEWFPVDLASNTSSSKSSDSSLANFIAGGGVAFDVFDANDDSVVFVFVSSRCCRSILVISGERCSIWCSFSSILANTDWCFFCLASIGACEAAEASSVRLDGVRLADSSIAVRIDGEEERTEGGESCSLVRMAVRTDGRDSSSLSLAAALLSTFLNLLTSSLASLATFLVGPFLSFPPPCCSLLTLNLTSSLALATNSAACLGSLTGVPFTAITLVPSSPPPAAPCRPKILSGSIRKITATVGRDAERLLGVMFCPLYGTQILSPFKAY